MHKYTKFSPIISLLRNVKVVVVVIVYKENHFMI